jgi:pyruvate/2-oxoacid:ferredoxin oxidoreductase beta subunit/Pyruvate/2-oxoacid:ferredoxin oxidoreductase gamma subunit
MKYLLDKQLPFCKGCGHHFITKNLACALEKIGINSRDVIIVTDIGCSGLIDEYFDTHTIHGLHGRATALGLGISVGIDNPKKKIIVIEGDGGATIGIAHLLEASRLNVNMTLFVLNNMLYGMTGGQVSGLTPTGFPTTVTPEGAYLSSYDICELAHVAGASLVKRIMGFSDYSEDLVCALKTEGFSIVEIIEMCTAYGRVSANELGKFNFNLVNKTNKKEPYKLRLNEKSMSLFTQSSEINGDKKANLDGKISIVISGSAGEGVQSAGEILCEAACIANLHATKKGDYPITVGTGFSSVQIIIGNKEINYTGITKPDVIIITSQDGLNYSLKDIKDESNVIMDNSINIALNSNKVTRINARNKAGGKGACLVSVTYFLSKTNILPIEALIEAAKKHKNSEKLINAIEIGRGL